MQRAARAPCRFTRTQMRAMPLPPRLPLPAAAVIDLRDGESMPLRHATPFCHCATLARRYAAARAIIDYAIFRLCRHGDMTDDSAPRGCAATPRQRARQQRAADGENNDIYARDAVDAAAAPPRRAATAAITPPRHYLFDARAPAMTILIYYHPTILIFSRRHYDALRHLCAMMHCCTYRQRQRHYHAIYRRLRRHYAVYYLFIIIYALCYLFDTLTFYVLFIFIDASFI